MTQAISISNEYRAAVGEALEPVVAASSQLEVVDQNSFEAAGFLLTDVIKVGIKKVHEYCDPICAASNAAHKAATNGRGELLAPWLKAETITKQKIGLYLDQQEEIRKAEEARIYSEHEAFRIAAEKHAREEAEGARLETAAELESIGLGEEAEALLDEEIVVDVSELIDQEIAVPAPAKVLGVSSRIEYNAEVTDLYALCVAIVKDRSLLNLVTPDVAKLRQRVRSVDGALKIPGVKVTQRRITSATAR